ncbi:MAG: hypothetical protein ACRC4M_04800 [Mycoplasma sp.]
MAKKIDLVKEIQQTVLKYGKLHQECYLALDFENAQYFKTLELQAIQTLTEIRFKEESKKMQQKLTKAKNTTSKPTVKKAKVVSQKPTIVEVKEEVEVLEEKEEIVAKEISTKPGTIEVKSSLEQEKPIIKEELTPEVDEDVYEEIPEFVPKKSKTPKIQESKIQESKIETKVEIQTPPVIQSSSRSLADFNFEEINTEDFNKPIENKIVEVVEEVKEINSIENITNDFNIELPQNDRKERTISLDGLEELPNFETELFQEEDVPEVKVENKITFKIM